MKKLVNALFSALLLSVFLLSCGGGSGVKGEWVSKKAGDESRIITRVFSSDGTLKETVKNKDGELISSNDRKYTYEEPILLIGESKYFVNGKTMIRYSLKAEKTASGSSTEAGEWVSNNTNTEYSFKLNRGGASSTAGCFEGSGTVTEISKYDGEEINRNIYNGTYEFNEKNNTLTFVGEAISSDGISQRLTLQGLIVENNLYFALYPSTSKPIIFEKK